MWWQRLLRLTHVTGFAMLVLGLLLQFVLKDRVFGFRLLFYAMPKPCLLVLAVTLLVWPQAAGRLRLLSAGAALLLGLTWAGSSWRGPAQAAMPAEPVAGEVRLLFWNLCRPHGVHNGLVEVVREFKPQVVACVEPGRHEMEQTCRLYEAQLPGYKAQWMPRGILWLSTVPARYRARGKLDGMGAYARFEVSGLGPSFPVVVADVHPHPFHWRKGQLMDALAQTGGMPDAWLLGDFNTPLESVLLEPYRSQMTHALEAAGHGFKETWPLGLPLLSLDHAWIGRQWEILDAQKVWRVPDSDHAALLVRLRRKPAWPAASTSPE